MVCLGFFDGVHIGHRALINAARAVAAPRGWIVVAHTFDRAPSPHGVELTDVRERARLLTDAGADKVVVSAFDDDMRAMPGERFFREVVLGQMHAAHVVCGTDHRFGSGGATDVNALRALCAQYGVGLTVVPDVTLENGVKVSSTAIRQAIGAGDLALARDMLGRQPTDEMLKRFPPVAETRPTI